MFTVHIEHAVQDFDGWKVVFDRFSDMRTRHRVRRYDVSRPTDDPNYVMIGLDFDSRSDADAFLTSMREVWGAPTAATVLAGAPRVRVTESVELGP
ncbi:hypothetical protein SAMN05216410_0003 [Sanguibacter gelidistatuariae]|uniref:Cyclase n=1 Tax=Sanguibacter gelidistatuariae TaxID=1814289 RepID=A0A1G6WTI0_9MICO|nr:hypothetical protein [Sanguibacter gelidistatuariae]SDD69240.1 hypothetical protein SAMN05216410_0003 [Sanguibacter gelidistatuariae]